MVFQNGMAKGRTVMKRLRELELDLSFEITTEVLEPLVYLLEELSDKIAIEMVHCMLLKLQLKLEYCARERSVQ